MPQCGQCGAQEPMTDELALLRGEDGQFRPLCRPCLEETGHAWPNPGIPTDFLVSRRAHLDSELEGMGDALGFFQADGKDGQAYARRFSRHEVNLTVRYHLEFDKRMHEGEVLDLSRGGLRFRTLTPLIAGQIILLEVSADKQADVHAAMRSRAKVCHVDRYPAGGHEIGVEFFPSKPLDHRDRREDPRYSVSMKAYFRRRGDRETSVAEVLDISRNGIGLLVRQLIPVGDLLLMVIQSEGDASHEIRMQGVVRVQRSIRKSEEEYELGALFLSRKPLT